MASSYLKVKTWGLMSVCFVEFTVAVESSPNEVTTRAFTSTISTTISSWHNITVRKQWVNDSKGKPKKCIQDTQILLGIVLVLAKDEAW